MDEPTMTYLIPDAAALEAQISDLKDAWLRDIRAHQDQCPATFSNCVPHDCGCGLTELREAEMDKIEKLNSQPAALAEMLRLRKGLDPGAPDAIVIDEGSLDQTADYYIMHPERDNRGEKK